MTHIPIRNKSKMALQTLIRRRKTTLKEFLSQRNIQTYAALENWCLHNGVANITPEEFSKLNIYLATDQGEGIVVIEALPELEPEPKKRKKKLATIDDI